MDDAEPVGDDEPIPLLEVWPGLRTWLGDRDGAELIRCDRIVDGMGQVLPFTCEAAEDGSVLLVRQADEAAELREVVRALRLGLSDEELEAILARETPADIAAQRERIRDLGSDAARLLAAVGEAALRRRLPPGLVSMLEEGAAPFRGERVAEAAIAQFHTGALREYKRDLAHLDPPKVWAGRPRAVEFVRSLGFGAEWAGRPGRKREPFVDVAGPMSLPPLHGYQRAAVENVRSMLGNRRTPLNRGEVGMRGLLSMPTGSGKTRVAVQAVIEAIRDDGFTGRCCGWRIGMSCASRRWRHGSRPGAASDRRRRRCGYRVCGRGQAAPVAMDGAHVIVATIQTLRARLSRRDVDFLENIHLLVVDEAHGSIAPTYTDLMAELGLGRSQRRDRIHLVGLTATPYRGISAEETERLVARYGRSRLDAGVFASDDGEEVVRQLQGMTVLAQVAHDVIPGGRYSLSPEELAEMQARDVPWLPETVQRRMADDAERTRRIVDTYLGKIHANDPECPTLIFATSVEHAEIVAALLSLEGVPARAVSGKTDAAARQDAVAQFRSGAVRVLVNYGVFREGFDAPKTQAIIVARPVYSPNLYFQMIGRGLRGELNGGSERCLILDVEDNIENYDRKLAFTELEGLWD